MTKDTPFFSSAPRGAASEAAAKWVIRLHSDSVSGADHAGFVRWLQENPSHDAEYAEQERIWCAVGALAANADARRFLLAPKGRVHQFVGRRALFSGLGLAAAASVAFLIMPESRPGQTYRSAKGERRTFTLEDGTTVVLNTDSQIHVQFYDHERRVHLNRGQVFLEVAKDRSRPFRVFAGDHEIRALGTAFDVFMDGQVTQVTLAEGKVGIFSVPSEDIGSKLLQEVRRDPPIESAAAVLEVGQQAIIAPMEPIKVENIDLHLSGAWREGRLIFERTPLDVAIRDVNRYRVRQLQLADAALANITISGVFSTSHLDSFAEVLAESFPVKIVSQDESTTVLGSP